MKKSAFLLFMAAILLPLGLYLILNDLPDTSSRRAQIIVQWTPATFGALFLIYGGIGLATAWSGAARKGRDAIDLAIGLNGITVRGGREIPWTAISSVTSIRYDNNSKIALLWDRADLNCAFEVRLNEAVDVPRLRTKDGVPCLKINLLRYPAAEYTRLYDLAVSRFEGRRIPVDTERKMKQT
ncbi:hypothetical protein [Salininema proteolyticum]|uniref:Uncharacterized protein n=1 Tax=Salininema proteolyticum TaxID=1607685 RepID=A0ABV8U4C3_9ACTN